MISTHICRYLIPYVYDRNLGKVAYEKVMVRFSRNDYEPDICFWRQEKAKDFGLKQSAFPLPDFIVEILSESTKERDRGIKFQDYALHGVEEYWIVDPETSTIEQYLLSDQTYDLTLKLKSGVILSNVIEGFQLEVDQLFNDE